LGGFEGDLDVVGIKLAHQHLIYVECSLDALSEEQRQIRFRKKFERGRTYIKNVFDGVSLPEKLDQFVVHQFASGKTREYGGGKLVLVRELIHEIYEGLKLTSPLSGAVPSNLPLLRTLQLAADARARGALTEYRLIRPGMASKDSESKQDIPPLKPGHPPSG